MPQDALQLEAGDGGERRDVLQRQAQSPHVAVRDAYDLALVLEGQANVLAIALGVGHLVADDPVRLKNVACRDDEVADGPRIPGHTGEVADVHCVLDAARRHEVRPAPVEDVVRPDSEHAPAIRISATTAAWQKNNAQFHPMGRVGIHGEMCSPSLARSASERPGMLDVFPAGRTNSLRNPRGSAIL